MSFRTTDHDLSGTSITEMPGAVTLVEEAPSSRMQARLAQRRFKPSTAAALAFGIVVLTMLSWQFVPEIHGAQNVIKWLNPFYISSPTRCLSELWDLMTGRHQEPYIWPYFWNTIEATVVGFFVGLAAGAGLGLVVSNVPRLRQVINPLVILFNSTPRIALIPVFVIIFGPTKVCTIINSAIVVFVVTFFNAVEGGKNVPEETFANIAIMGASSLQLMRYVRLPVVIMWTFAALPNAISFALLTVVTTEVLTGITGLGALILTALDNVNANLTMAIFVLLGTMGIALNGFAVLVKKRVLRWQP